MNAGGRLRGQASCNFYRGEACRCAAPALLGASQVRGEVDASAGGRFACDLFWGSPPHDLAAAVTAVRTEVDHAVSGGDDVEVGGSCFCLRPPLAQAPQDASAH
jgi:hypothetical protein